MCGLRIAACDYINCREGRKGGRADGFAKKSQGITGPWFLVPALGVGKASCCVVHVHWIRVHLGLGKRLALTVMFGLRMYART